MTTSAEPAAALHGWLIVDKPLGPTSAAVVGRVRRACGGVKVGHAGTLDPLATGVLPLALGEATKAMAFVMNGRKTYRFAVRWGEARATDDAEGAITATSPLRPTRAAIEAALPAFIGAIAQMPPAYSAVTVDGRRAYARARAGEAVVLAARTVHIETLVLVDRPDEATAVFEVGCGKGMYVRALARDLARRLGTVGFVAALRRLRAGPFVEADAIPMDNFLALGHIPRAERLLPVKAALADIPAIALTEPEADKIRRGQHIRVRHPTPGTVCLTAGDKLVALAEVEGETARPKRVFNL
jgi:tRNA pseudouridine55 synthase